MLQIFSKLSIITSYQLNKDFISQVLCINKSAPELQCEGKCFLSKQLAQAEEHEKAPAGDSQVKFDLLYYQVIYTFKFRSVVVLLISSNTYILPHYPSPSFSVFYPPKV